MGVLLRTGVDGVVLRELGAADAPAFHGLLQANRGHLLRLNDDHLGQIETTVEEHARRFGDATDRTLYLGIVEHGRLVGHVALVHREPPRWGLGYWLAEEATGRGLATAAVAAVVDHGRTALGAEDVLAGVSHGNDASVAVLTRNGFERVAEFPTYDRYARRL
jgi:RimJ/RimL family protein N-acetyltransferase